MLCVPDGFSLALGKRRADGLRVQPWIYRSKRRAVWVLCCRQIQVCRRCRLLLVLSERFNVAGRQHVSDVVHVQRRLRGHPWRGMQRVCRRQVCPRNVLLRHLPDALDVSRGLLIVVCVLLQRGVLRHERWHL